MDYNFDVLIPKAKKLKKRYMLYTIVSILLVALIITYAIVVRSIMYIEIDYLKDRADAKLSKANSTSDLIDFADYVNEYYDMILKDKSGNPDWWFPTEKTDWDDIKHDVKKIITNAILSDNSTKVGTDAYEEILQELKGDINKISDRIDSAWGMEYYYQPIFIWCVWIGIISCIVFSIFFFYFMYSLFEDYDGISYFVKRLEEKETYRLDRYNKWLNKINK